MQKSPDKFRPNYNIGTKLGENGKLVEAEQYLAHAKALNPRSSEVYNQLGNIYLLTKRNQDALYHYQQAVQNNNNNVEALYNLATLQESEGMMAEALENYRRFVELSEPMPGFVQYRQAVQLKIQRLQRLLKD